MELTSAHRGRSELEDRYKRDVNSGTSLCEQRSQEIADLKDELVKIRSIAEEKSSLLEQKTLELSELEPLRKDLDRMKRELSAKTLDLEENVEAISNKEGEVKALRAQLDATQLEMDTKNSAIHNYDVSLKEMESKYHKQLDEYKRMLNDRLAEKEEMEKKYEITITRKQTQLEEATKRISERSADMEKINSELAETKKQLEITNSEDHDRHSRQIRMKEEQLMKLSAEILQKNEEITKCSIVTSKLEDDICSKNGVIEKLKFELESLKRRLGSGQDAVQITNAHFNQLQLEHGDLQRKLATKEQELQSVLEQKQSFESQLHQLMNFSGDKDAKCNQLSTELREKEAHFETTRTELTEQLHQTQRRVQELSLQLHKMVHDSELVKKDFDERFSTSVATETMLKERCQSSVLETTKVRDELMLRLTELQHVLEQKDFELKKAEEISAENQRYHKEKLEYTTTELQKMLGSCQARINSLTSESVSDKQLIAQKTETLIEVEAKFKHDLAEAQHQNLELKMSLEEQLKKVEFALAQKVMEFQKAVTEIQLLKQDCGNSNISLDDKNRHITELTSQLQALQQLTNKLQEEVDRLQLGQQSVQSQLQQSTNHCSDLLATVEQLSTRAEHADKLARDLDIQKSMYFQLLQQVRLTQSQKESLIQRLEETARQNGENEKCHHLLELAKNIQAGAQDELLQKLIVLQRVLAEAQQSVASKETLLEEQQQEILHLQEELLQVSDCFLLLDQLLLFYSVNRLELPVANYQSQGFRSIPT